MSELPPPLTPADCDLRHYDWMPLNIATLKDSRSWMRCKRNPALAFYLINLWTASWYQVPAASLEDDDEYLCDLAQCDQKTWEKMREFILAGFVKCSDGRLYHQYVAGQANKSWQLTLAQRSRTEAATAARKARQPSVTNNVTSNVTNNDDDKPESDVTIHVTSSLRGPQDKTRQDSTIRKETAANAAAKKIGERAPAVRGTRLPEDWLPSPADRDYATERGLSWERVLEDFRGYWLAKAGKDAIKTDWSLTWQGWCRRQAERSPQPQNLLTHPPRLVHNSQGISAFGPVEAWLAPPINAKLSTDPRDAGKPIVGGSYIDFCAQALLDITGIPDTPRTDWHILADWVRDDSVVWADDVAPVLRRMAARPDYEPPSSLKYFDRAVRESRRAA